jgi:hypothetical protein
MVVAVTVGVLLGFGCDDPELNTDLRPAGDPEVLAVLVMTDAAFHLSEQATYCKLRDELRPGLVGLPDFTTQQVCPETLSEGVDAVDKAYPDGWYVRIMFDELLDPSIEELTEIIDEDTGQGTGSFEGSIAGADPVSLECQSVVGDAFVKVDYDGYYSPSGNRVTWPVGPSLVIKPNAPELVATGKECQLFLNGSIVDKDGNDVPLAQRGPYTFKIAPVTIIATDPSDSDPDDQETAPALTEVDAHHLYFSNFYFQFNTEVTIDSICDDVDLPGTFEAVFADADFGFGYCDEGTEQFQIDPPVLPSDAGGGWGVCNFSGDPCSTFADCTDPDDDHCDSTYAYTFNGLAADDEIGIGYNTPLKTETAYTFSLKTGTKLKDRCGVETTLTEPTPANFQVVRFLTNPFELVEGSETNILTGDVAPMVRKPTLSFTNVVDPSTLDTSEYTLTPTPDSFAISQFTGGDIIFAGNYAPDTMYTLTINAGATFSDYYGASFTTAEAITVSWKTQPKITLTASSPADNDEVQKLQFRERVDVALSFNANMDPATLEPGTDFTFVNSQTNVAVPAYDPATAPNGFIIAAGSGGSGNYCAPDSLGCDLRIRADLPPGSYKFTLKAGAMVSDLLGNAYTQEKDLIINFTVLPAAAATPCL